MKSNRGKGDPDRRFFDAVVRTGDLGKKPNDPQRFLKAMLNFDDKLDLLFRITNDEGPATLRKAIVRVGGTTQGLKSYLFPILEWLGSDELCGMMCRPQVCEIAHILLTTPGLLKTLLKLYESETIGSPDTPVGAKEQIC